MYYFFIIIFSALGAVVGLIVIYFLGVTSYLVMRALHKEIKNKEDGITFRRLAKLNLLVVSFLSIVIVGYYSLFFILKNGGDFLSKQQKQRQLLVIFDLDEDNDIDVYDLKTLLNNWGVPKNSKTDLNKDGKVDLIDFNILLPNFK